MNLLVHPSLLSEQSRKAQQQSHLRLSAAVALRSAHWGLIAPYEHHCSWQTVIGDLGNNEACVYEPQIKRQRRGYAEIHVNGLGICSFISHSARTALVLDKGLTSNRNIRTNVSQTKAIVCFFSTYMRLLGGILRRSLNQVTWGWGKLRMRGAGMTAPSPWETDWERSPSSKLPITAGKQRHDAGETEGTQSFPFLSSNF